MFGHRGVGNIRASEIQTFLTGLKRRYGPSTSAGAYLVLQGILALAVTDELIKKSPATAETITKPVFGIGPRVVAWGDDYVDGVIAAHPAELRLIPVIMAATGMRIGEVLALSIDDLDFENHIVHVQRQLKKLGRVHVFALPKNDRELDVPTGQWVEQAVLAFVSQYTPRALSLPWEEVDGPPLTVHRPARALDGPSPDPGK